MLDLRAEYEYMKADIDSAIARCLEHQKWILGPEVAELESQVAKYVGVEHCIGASSGTEALVLALRALAIQRKGEEYFDRSDLIITTPFTFTATGDAILRAGATPLFVDVDPTTYNIDPVLIRSCLEFGSHNPSPIAPRLKIVGIIPVHLYGRACEMDHILGVAQQNGLFVVEDVAQAFGGTFEGRKLGSLGNAGAFSFFPSKNLGGFGDAGMVSTNDDELAHIVRMLIKHGGKDKYNVDHIGYNARMDTIQAAILLAKLKYIDDFNYRRIRIASLYSEGLKDVTDITLPLQAGPAKDGEGSGHVFHQYTVRVNAGKRDLLQRQLKSKGIDSMVYYPVPLHKMKVFQGRYALAGVPETAESSATEVLSLPIEPLMRKDQYERVIDAIVELASNRRLSGHEGKGDG